jgi:hypothetical protein
MHYQRLDTGEACIIGINCTGDVTNSNWPVSTTPVRHDVTSIDDTGNDYIDGVLDTVKCIQMRNLFDTDEFETNYLIRNLFDTDLFDTELT